MSISVRDISSEDLFELFPDRMFPDIEDIAVFLDQNALRICGTNTDWSMQSDVQLAGGDGCMSLIFSGQPTIKFIFPEGERVQNSKQWIGKKIDGIQFFRMIKRGHPWEFIFSGTDDSNIHIQAEIVHIAWEKTTSQ